MPTCEESLFLSSRAIGLQQWRALRILHGATGEFEPLTTRVSIKGQVLAELIKLGLAEAGPLSSRFDVRYGPTGYRLSGLGKLVLSRGPWVASPAN